ncbi:hypothetical protein AAMO2058_000642000 [Amorphochlora amoebiformis]
MSTFASRRESRRFSFKVLRRLSLEKPHVLHVDVPDGPGSRRNSRIRSRSNSNEGAEISVPQRGRRTRSASIASLRSVGTIKCEEKTLDPVTLRFDDEDLEVDFSKKYNSHHFEVSTRTAAVAIFLQVLLLFGEFQTGLLSSSTSAMLLALFLRLSIVASLIGIIIISQNNPVYFLENMQLIELVVYSYSGVATAILVVVTNSLTDKFTGDFVKGAAIWQSSFERPYEPVSGFVCAGNLFLFLAVVFSLTCMQFVVRLGAALPTCLWIFMKESSNFERVTEAVFSFSLIFALAYGEYQNQKQMRKHWLLEKELVSDTAKYEELLKEILPSHVKDDLQRRVRSRSKLLIESRRANRTARSSSPPSPDPSVAENFERKMSRGSAVPLPTSVRFFPEVTILFCYICDFPSLVRRKSPLQLVRLLNDVFSHFDTIIQTYRVYKMEAIAQTYLLTAGCPEPCSDHFSEIASAALTMQKLCRENKFGGEKIQLKIGINSGPIAAGVVGSRASKFQLFGDTVNTASRMASKCPPGKIQISEAAYMSQQEQRGEYETSDDRFVFTCRGEIPVKGKGFMRTYFLDDYETYGESNNQETPNPTIPKDWGFRDFRRRKAHSNDKSSRPNPFDPANAKPKPSLTRAVTTSPTNGKRRYRAPLMRQESRRILETPKRYGRLQVRPSPSFNSRTDLFAGSSSQVDDIKENQRGVPRTQTMGVRGKFGGGIRLEIPEEDTSEPKLRPPSNSLWADSRRSSGEQWWRSNSLDLSATAREIGSDWDLEVQIEVSPYTLKFSIPELEEEYMDEYIPRSIEYVTATLAATALTVLTAEAINLTVFKTERLTVLFTSVGFLAILIALPSLLPTVAERFSPEIAESGLAFIYSSLIVISCTTTFHEVPTFKFLLAYIFAVQSLHVRLHVAVIATTISITIIGISAWIHLRPIPYYVFIAGHIALGGLGVSFARIYRRDLSERRRFVLRKMVHARRDELMEVLGRMMPDPSIARALLHEQEVALPLDDVTYLYSDIKGFTKLSSRLDPIDVVELLNELYSKFDSHLDEHKVYKIDTIGDAYVVVGGLNQGGNNEHPDRILNFAFDMLREINTLISTKNHRILGKEELEDVTIGMRIGVHTGSGIGGVIGKKKPRFFIWGIDSMIAEGMESSGGLNVVHVSEATKRRLNKSTEYKLKACEGEGKEISYFAHYDEDKLNKALEKRKNEQNTH